MFLCEGLRGEGQMRSVSTGNTAMLLTEPVIGVPIHVAPKLNVDLLVEPDRPAVRDSYRRRLGSESGGIIVRLTALVPKAGSARDDR
jgi:hypothetical protein